MEEEISFELKKCSIKLKIQSFPEISLLFSSTYSIWQFSLIKKIIILINTVKALSCQGYCGRSSVFYSRGNKMSHQSDASMIFILKAIYNKDIFP